jgi:hypothetical protein
MNHQMFRLPDEAVGYEALNAPSMDQVREVLHNFDDFNRGRAYIAKVEIGLRNLVGTRTYNQFEEALENLGRVLGFSAERPDQKLSKGPDVLWLTHEHHAFVIEAKSKKLNDNPLNGEEYGQILRSIEWAKEHFPGWSLTGVIVLPQPHAVDSLTIRDTMAMSFEKLESLKSSVRLALRQLSELPRTSADRVVKAEAILREHHLSADSIHHFFETFIPVRDRAGERIPLL